MDWATLHFDQLNRVPQPHLNVQRIYHARVEQMGIQFGCNEVHDILVMPADQLGYVLLFVTPMGVVNATILKEVYDAFDSGTFEEQYIAAALIMAVYATEKKKLKL